MQDSWRLQAGRGGWQQEARRPDPPSRDSPGPEAITISSPLVPGQASWGCSAPKMGGGRKQDSGQGPWGRSHRASGEGDTSQEEPGLGDLQRGTMKSRAVSVKSLKFLRNRPFVSVLHSKRPRELGLLEGSRCGGNWATRLTLEPGLARWPSLGSPCGTPSRHPGLPGEHAAPLTAPPSLTRRVPKQRGMSTRVTSHAHTSVRWPAALHRCPV